ncbi:hypothetical protein GCM10020220_026960 [Nonomuraea rubra]
MGEGAGDLGAAAGDAGAARDGGVERRRGDDLLVEHDGDAAPGVVLGPAGRVARELAPGGLLAEVEAHPPAGAALGVALLGGVAYPVAGDGGGAELEQAAVLVAYRLLVAGLGGAEHGVERELRGAADDLGGLARVEHARQLDDDPPLAGADQGGIDDAERVGPLAQHVERAVGGGGVGLDGGGVLRLEDELGAAAQVQAQAGGGGEGGH